MMSDVNSQIGKSTSPDQTVRNPATLNNLPPRHPKFIGRSKELQRLHWLLQQHQNVAVNQPAQYQHLGGFGKTALAVHYAWSALEKYPGGVFFVNASSGVLLSEIAKLAHIFGAKSFADEKRAAAQVCDHLEERVASLLILDGLDDPGKWITASEQELIPEGNCRCLITTNCSQIDGVEMLTIGGLPREHGVRALAAYRADALDEGNRSFAGDIVEWLAGFPVGLSIIGASMSLNDEVTWQDLHQRFGSLCKAPGEGEERAVDYFLPVIHNIFDEILDSLPYQQRIAMEYATLLPTNRVVLSWLRPMVESNEATKLAKFLGKVESGKKVLAQLLSLQLLRANAPGCAVIGMPHVVRSRLLSHFEQDRHDEVFNKLVAATTRRAKDALKNAKAKPTGTDELTSMAQFVKELKRHGKYETGAAMAKQTALLLHRMGRFYEVLDLLDTYLDDEAIDNLDPKLITVLMSDKAAALTAIGEMGDTKRLMERALQLGQRSYPPDDPALAELYSNLAGVLKTTGDLVKARRFLEQAIEIDEKKFGKTHPKLGMRWWWIAEIDLAEKKQEDACSHYRHAYKIMKMHYSDDHRHVRALAKMLKEHCDD